MHCNNEDKKKKVAKDMIITIENNNNEIDIRVDERQKVRNVLLEICKNGFVNWNEKNVLSSVRNQRVVCLDKSFCENEIYNGDKLEIE